MVYRRCSLESKILPLVAQSYGLMKQIVTLILGVFIHTQIYSQSVPSKVKSGLGCNDFPYKLGCSNEIIKKVQKCLDMEPKYQTGYFGEMTLKHLKSKRGEDQITKEVYESILLNCSLIESDFLPKEPAATKNRYNSSPNKNYEQNYNSSHSKDVLVLCTTESEYNYVSYYKLTLYQDGSASMDKDGNILIGTWYERNGLGTTITTRFNGVYLRIEKPIGENFYMESSGRMWHICF